MRLIDADALIAEIEKRRRAAKTLTGVDMVMLIKDAPTVGGWISVKDRLPEKDGEYLVFINTGCITICWYDGQKWLDSDGCEWAEKYVSHWAALPKPPEVSE